MWVGRPAWVSQFGKVGLAFLLVLGGAVALVVYPEAKIAALVAIGLGLLLWLVAWVRVVTSRYEITSNRAITREGLLRQTRSEVLLNDVRNVVLQRSIADRLLGLGTVALSTSGQAGLELTMRAIRNPQAVVDLINKYNR